MQRLERTVRVAATPAAVFAFLADPDNLPRWQPGMLKAERTSPPPTVIGSTARVLRDVMGQRVAVTLTVSELVPGRRLALTSTASGFTVTIGADLEPDADATILRIRAEVRADSPFLAPLESMLIGPAGAELDAGLARLQHVFAPVTEPDR